MPKQQQQRPLVVLIVVPMVVVAVGTGAAAAATTTAAVSGQEEKEEDISAMFLPTSSSSRHSINNRGLQTTFDFFSTFCQSEGADFLSCLSTFPTDISSVSSRDSCETCSLQTLVDRAQKACFILNNESGNLGGSFDDICSAQCGGCTTKSTAAISCASNEVRRRGCGDELGALDACSSIGCSSAQTALETCLTTFQERQQQSFLQGILFPTNPCRDEVNAFDTCVNSELLDMTDRNKCTACYSRYGFGLTNNASGCSSSCDNAASSCKEQGQTAADCLRPVVENSCNNADEIRDAVRRNLPPTEWELATTCIDGPGILDVSFGLDFLVTCEQTIAPFTPAPFDYPAFSPTTLAPFATPPIFAPVNAPSPFPPFAWTPPTTSSATNRRAMVQSSGGVAVLAILAVTVSMAALQ